MRLHVAVVKRRDGALRLSYQDADVVSRSRIGIVPFAIHGTLGAPVVRRFCLRPSDAQQFSRKGFHCFPLLLVRCTSLIQKILVPDVATRFKA